MHRSPKVKDWIVRHRPWFEISAVEKPQKIRGLHRGETEGLQLALQCKAELAGVRAEEVSLLASVATGIGSARPFKNKKTGFRNQGMIAGTRGIFGFSTVDVVGLIDASLYEPEPKTVGSQRTYRPASTQKKTRNY
jgi:hypothetical protein